MAAGSPAIVALRNKAIAYARAHRHPELRGADEWDRKFLWARGARPIGYPGLSELGL